MRCGPLGGTSACKAYLQRGLARVCRSVGRSEGGTILKGNVWRAIAVAHQCPRVPVYCKYNIYLRLALGQREYILTLATWLGRSRHGCGCRESICKHKTDDFGFSSGLVSKTTSICHLVYTSVVVLIKYRVPTAKCGGWGDDVQVAKLWSIISISDTNAPIIPITPTVSTTYTAPNAAHAK